MKALGWLYRRIGQFVCFTAAIAALMFTGSDYASDGDQLAASIAFLGFILAGVGLRAINVWKESGGAR